MLGMVLHGVATSIADTTTTTTFRVTKLDTRQGPQVVVEMGFNTPLVRQYAGQEYRMMEHNIQSMGDMVYALEAMRANGVRLGLEGEHMDQTFRFAKERQYDPYLYYLFRKEDGWYGYARRYPEEKMYYSNFSRTLRFPVEEEKVIAVGRHLSNFLDEKLSKIRWR